MTYDQMLHPQKRRILKDLVVSVMGRILELKQVCIKSFIYFLKSQKMVELQSSDYHHFSDILLDLKMSPEDLIIRVPRMFQEGRAPEVEARFQLLVWFYCCQQASLKTAHRKLSKRGLSHSTNH